MARLFIDGAESGDLHCWDVIFGGSTGLAVVAGSLTPGQGSYKFKSGNYNQDNSYVVKNISPANPAAVKIKFYFEYTANGSNAEISWVGNSQGVQLCLCLESNGTLSVRKSSKNGTQLAVGTKTLLPNTPYLIEAYFFLDASGAIQTKIGGVTDINFSGNTTNQASNTITYFTIGWINDINISGANFYWDHVAVDDTDWPGDGSIFELVLDADGDNAQLTPSAGSNYACVADVPGSDADYVYGNTDALEDNYQHAAIPSWVASINAVQLLIRAQGVGAPSVGGLKHVLRIAATDYDGPRKTVPVGTLTNLLNLWQKSPATAVDFTVSEVNGLQTGVKLAT